MEQLRAARALALPDWCIAAGFVRNRVWDHLHGIVPARLPADIDVIYYDAGDPLGTDDLLGLRCRPTDFGATRRSEYEERIASKRWRELWPKVQFLD